MINKKIFNKKKKYKKQILFLFLILIIIILLINFYIFNYNNKFIIVDENRDSFFIIPEDRGGEKVLNLNKKSLNLKLGQNSEYNYDKDDNLFFSIQFYANENLEKVSKFLNKITDVDETIYNKDDFYILALNSQIGIEYFLLYKNFKNKEKAKNYCLNFLPKNDICLIVDTTKF